MFVECPICQKKVETKPTKTGKALHYYCPWHFEGKFNVKALREAIASGKLTLAAGSVLQLKLEEGGNGAGNHQERGEDIFADARRVSSESEVEL